MRPDLELLAQIIAENVASALVRACDSGFQEGERAIVVQGVMRELLLVLPTDDSDRLTEACNRGLQVLIGMGVYGPRVAAVDPDHGSVTMQQG